MVFVLLSIAVPVGACRARLLLYEDYLLSLLQEYLARFPGPSPLSAPFLSCKNPPFYPPLPSRPVPE